MIKSAIGRNVNAPPARRRRVKTKSEIGRGNLTERKEMSRSARCLYLATSFVVLV